MQVQNTGTAFRSICGRCKYGCYKY